MLDLAAIILTFNEERHIERAISSVRSIARDIIVVDSFSTDRTVEIAQSTGARVLQNSFVNHSLQFQWALENAPTDAAWLMRLDADEVVSADLAMEIERELPRLPRDVVGINLQRRHIFLGRWIRHGDRFPLTLLRIWRTGLGSIEERWMDEHMIVQGGRTVTFQGGFEDHNLRGIGFFTEKHNAYATREAMDVLIGRYALLARSSQPLSSWQARTKRALKQQVYQRLPFYFAVPGYFVYRYVFRLGFMDGREGLIYHFLQGFWYRFLVGAKVFEWDRDLIRMKDNKQRLAYLENVTGYNLTQQADSSDD